jgi:hypothetical protein
MFLVITNLIIIAMIVFIALTHRHWHEDNTSGRAFRAAVPYIWLVWLLVLARDVSSAALFGVPTWVAFMIPLELVLTIVWFVIWRIVNRIHRESGYQPVAVAESAEDQEDPTPVKEGDLA